MIPGGKSYRDSGDHRLKYIQSEPFGSYHDPQINERKSTSLKIQIELILVHFLIKPTRKTNYKFSRVRTLPSQLRINGKA